MNDAVMMIYMAAKADCDFIKEASIARLCNIPKADADIDEKKRFAACYAGYLFGRGRWDEFSEKHNFFE
jgi:hypothetical protein